MQKSEYYNLRTQAVFNKVLIRSQGDRESIHVEILIFITKQSYAFNMYTNVGISVLIT